MAEDEGGEKTEQPTGRRVSQSREEGMVPRSIELSQVLSMSTAFLVLGRVSPALWTKLKVLCTAGFTSSYGRQPITVNDIRIQFVGLAFYLLPEILTLLIASAVVGALSTLLQTNFNWSTKLLKPKWMHLNPLAGIKRIFSVQNAVQLLKSVAKLAIIGPLAYFSFVDFFPQMLTLIDLPLSQLLPFTGIAAGTIFWRIMKLMLVLSILDYVYQRYRIGKQMMMSKQEVKDERLSTEGDESMRMKIRYKGFERIRKRMLQNVKTADVVVTNPTTYAVALKYSPEAGAAPKVVAKGKNHLCHRIKELARENGVPVIERKTLARALYAAVEVGQEIPYELYAAVAELLAYVFRLKGKMPFRKKPQPEKPAQG